MLNSVRDVLMKECNNQDSCFYLDNKERCVQGCYKQVLRKRHYDHGKFGSLKLATISFSDCLNRPWRRDIMTRDCYDPGCFIL